ncbi:MAG: hypothetical protein ACXWEY_06095 [Bacteroidia bacterium]
MLLFFVSCNTSKTALQHQDNQLEIAQNNLPQPYIAVPENALEPQQNTEKPALRNGSKTTAESNISSTSKKHYQNIKTTAAQSVKKIKKLVPDTRNFVQSASKKWNPNKQNFTLSWKDVVFVLVLLALLALMGGILHNLVGLSLVWTLVITIGIAFLVVCIYLWYLHNN